MVAYMESQTEPSYMSVNCTRLTLRMPNFTRAPHAQPSLSNFSKWDSNFGELTHSRWTTDSDELFQLPPKIKLPNSHIVRYTCQFEQYLPHTQNERRAHHNWAPTKEPTVIIEVYHIQHFLVSHGRCATSGSPMGRSGRSP